MYNVLNHHDVESHLRTAKPKRYRTYSMDALDRMTAYKRKGLTQEMIGQRFNPPVGRTYISHLINKRPGFDSPPARRIIADACEIPYETYWDEPDPG